MLFCPSVSGPHNENVFSRCKSKLIVISNEDQAYKIVPSDDCDSGIIIPVYGKFSINTSLYLFSESFKFLQVCFTLIKLISLIPRMNEKDIIFLLAHCVTYKWLIITRLLLASVYTYLMLATQCCPGLFHNSICDSYPQMSLLDLQIIV